MLKFIRYFVLLLTLTMVTKSFAQNTGLGTKNPANTLTVDGSFAADYKIVTANTTLGVTDYYTAYNANRDGIITLPAAISGTGNFKGRIYTIKNTTPISALTVAANGAEQIDGAANVSSVIVPPGYSVKLISKGTTTGSTWEFLSLVIGKTDNIVTLSATPYLIPQNTFPTQTFSVDGTSYTIIDGTSYGFTLPVSRPIFISFGLGVDDITANNSRRPYFRCEIFIDNQPTGLFQIIREYQVGYQMQFNFSGVIDLPAGFHRINARITRWYDDGQTARQSLGTLSVFFDAVYLN